VGPALQLGAYDTCVDQQYVRASTSCEAQLCVQGTGFDRTMHTLSVDPVVLIDAMLLQHRRPFAIAAHPGRRNAWDESEASKEHKAQYSAQIDNQIMFYEQEGFPLEYEKYDSRQGGLIGIATDVPESNTVIREHNSLTNLFSCIWFNEVVRFSQREQISFGYVKKRMSLRLPMYIWPDCRELFSLTHPHVST